MKLSNLKILLVEYDPFVADAFHKFFKSMGCFFVIVESAKEGIRLLEKENFDVIASENELLGNNGLVFFRHVKSLNPNAVSILITNYNDPIRFSRPLRFVLDNTIEKPFPFGEFLNIVARHVKVPAERSKIISFPMQ